jgi:hypothetical protein
MGTSTISSTMRRKTKSSLRDSLLLCNSNWPPGFDRQAPELRVMPGCAAPNPQFKACLQGLIVYWVTDIGP